ncbi:MAG: hypothetical protein CVV10_03595 [Gammaproteobacteria bacterium HGW-Gammaproteobacteria-14]|nr:MAG: hypothetical protein CVV10_03595 [Gammaproteobacteria bacterium HGW-Gammaproteobacteria-14]
MDFTKPSFMVMPLLSLFMLTLAGCGGGGDSDSGARAPDSIIGYTLVQTIQETNVLSSTATSQFLQPGDTLTYRFIDSTTIQGEGFNVVPTTGWSYSTSGSSATVNLRYQAGDVEDELNFTSELGGTFSGIHELFSTGARVNYKGTFRISGGSSSDTGGSDNTGGGSSSACETNNTGSFTVYVSASNPNPPVTVTVAGLGTRSTSQYFPSGSPTCGSSVSGAMTFSNVAAGSYSVSASDNGGGVTWGPGVSTIPKCGCRLLELQ